MIEDEYIEIGEADTSIRAANIESEIGIIHLQSSLRREQSKTRGCLESTTESFISLFDRPISPSVALSRGRTEQAIRDGDHGVAATVHPPHAVIVTLSLPKQPQDQGGSALDKEEWEIVKIVGKRRTSKGYEYKMRWKNIWLLERELGNV